MLFVALLLIVVVAGQVSAQTGGDASEVTEPTVPEPTVPEPTVPEEPPIPDARRWVEVDTSVNLLADGLDENGVTAEGFSHWAYLPDYLPNILKEPDLAQDLSWVIDELLKHPEVSQVMHYDREVLAITSTLSSEELQQMIATALTPHISSAWSDADIRPFDLDLDASS
ncbi:MAG: hypothetical protein H0T94_09655 [Acidimicrobiia bacterium]|nr:hypothetical protein [Acidimicrobiia bacterium]MDQ3500024.1 hypothetical protein [Actinomycetota bacterium]